MERPDKDILERIDKNLTKIMVFMETDNLSKESERLFRKSDRRVEYSIKQIQSSFNRIHDKLFRLNNILIGIYIVLSTYPIENPKLRLWTVLFPLINLVYFIWLVYKQMGIHRFASNEQNWNKEEREEYGKKINSQNLFSLLSIISTSGVIIFLIFNIK